MQPDGPILFDGDTAATQHDLYSDLKGHRKGPCTAHAMGALLAHRESDEGCNRRQKRCCSLNAKTRGGPAALTMLYRLLLYLVVIFIVYGVLKR